MTVKMMVRLPDNLAQFIKNTACCDNESQNQVMVDAIDRYAMVKAAEGFNDWWKSRDEADAITEWWEHEQLLDEEATA